MLVSCATSARSGGVVKVWACGDAGVGAAICEVETHPEGLSSARLSATGDATVSCGGDLALCAIRDAAVALRLGGDAVAAPGAPRGVLRCCDFDKSSRLVACGGDGGALDVWDCKRKRVVRTLEDHASAVTCCRFDASAATVASGNGAGEVLVHRVRSRQLVALRAATYDRG
mmetsp:Transcript_25814/g.77762  ORF Transcript_25814/g.77762 Transcript_25814/m.77762 type:complete len:172 (-) Transcript_25814:8-523(-)